MTNPRHIGALWQRSYIDRRTGEVKEYFSGVLNFLGEPIPIVVFKNHNKEVDAQPDYLNGFVDHKTAFPVVCFCPEPGCLQNGCFCDTTSV